jgi:hypothetical protein
MQDEISLMEHADVIVTVSQAERNSIISHGVRNVVIWGHSMTSKLTVRSFSERAGILFVGGFLDPACPNEDAMLYFVREVFPLIREKLDTQLFIVGTNYLDSIKNLASASVVVTGRVDNLEEYYDRCRIFIVPTRYSAGIPLKLQEAMSYGLPAVVSPLVAEQLDLSDGHDVLVADSSAAFAEQVISLYKDETLWTNIRNCGLRRVQDICNPQKLKQDIEETLHLKAAHLGNLEPARTDCNVYTDRGRSLSPSDCKEAPLHLKENARPLEEDYSLAIPFTYPLVNLEPYPRVAVICHIFYEEVAIEIKRYLNNIPFPADLFISSNTTAKQDIIERCFAGWDRGAVEVRVMENRGRDIAPKLVGFRDVYERYDYVLHIHSKRTSHASILATWRSFLFENLIGSPVIVRSIFEAFTRHPELGIVASQHFEPVRQWLNWERNFDKAKELAAKFGVRLSPDSALDFPSGSMFWARSAALTPLLDIGLSFDDFGEELDQTDGTLAHAIERLYFIACERAGFTWCKVANPQIFDHTSCIVEIDSPKALSCFMEHRIVKLTGTDPLVTRKAPPLPMPPPQGLMRLLQAREKEVR